jgi:hypothetical protein
MRPELGVKILEYTQVAHDFEADARGEAAAVLNWQRSTNTIMVPKNRQRLSNEVTGI